MSEKWPQERINAYINHLKVDEDWLRCLENDLIGKEEMIANKKENVERHKKDIAKQKERLAEQGVHL